VLVLDLHNEAEARLAVNQQRIGLTPASTSCVLELNPRAFSVLKLCPPQRKKREMLLRLSLVPLPDCKSAAALSPSNELRLSR